MNKMVRAFVAAAVIGVAGISPSFAESKLDLDWGAQLRLRHEYWKNVTDMNNGNRDDRSFYRFKLSLWGSAYYGKDYGVFMKLTDESKAYVEYQGGNAGYNINETVFDNLYADWNNILGAPVDLRVGRQDFNTYGEGFLIMDGTPLDGSRTFYFNAARASWRINSKNTLDAIAIDGTKYDQFKVINEYPGRTQLNPADETAAILYYKGDTVRNLHLEAYYIYKDEKGGASLMNTYASRLNTVGSFARYNLAPWTLRGQLAFQNGDYGDNDRSGIGGYAYIDRSFKEVCCKPAASLGYIYLSGDDPTTAKNEGWDPLFSRYPWVSELYTLSYGRESGNGYWTNLRMFRAMLSAVPFKKGQASLNYNYLWANEALNRGIFGSGKDRGQLWQGKIGYEVSKNITTYVLAEYFLPGSFYTRTAQDPALFTRAEVMLKY